MKIKYLDTEIECTVDEFEDMIARGIFGTKVKPERFGEESLDDHKLPISLPKIPTEPPKRWPPTVALYGCEAPQDYKLDTAYDANNCTINPEQEK